MKKKIFYTSLLVISGLLLTTACNRNKNVDELSHHHHSHSTGHHHHDGDDDDEEEEEDAITLSPAKAQKFGVVAEEIMPKPFNEAIKVSASVTAPPSMRKALVAKSSGLISISNTMSPGSKVGRGQTVATINGTEVVGGDITKSLQLEYNAAKRELDRLTPLYEKGIVSAKEYNEAVLNAEKTKAALGTINTNTTGGTVVSAPDNGTLISILVNDGDYVVAGQTIGYVGDNTTLSLQADLPKKYHNKASLITDAFVVPSCGDCEGFVISKYGGRRLQGNANVNDEKVGFLPIYFTFNNNGLIEGSGYVDAYMLLETQREALSVPNEALVEQQGQWFVYVQLDEDCYEKRPVKIGGSNGEEIEVLEGIQAGENVVIKGTTFVKLAETADAVPEAHSHSH